MRTTTVTMVLKAKMFKESKTGLVLSFYQLNRRFFQFLPNCF